MKILLNTLGSLMWLFALGSCATAKGALHEAFGATLMLTGAIFFCTAAIIGELTDIRKAISPPPPPIKGPGDLDKSKRFKWSDIFG
jgi:hypothetical protein